MSLNELDVVMTKVDQHDLFKPAFVIPFGSKGTIVSISEDPTGQSPIREILVEFTLTSIYGGDIASYSDFDLILVHPLS